MYSLIITPPIKFESVHIHVTTFISVHFSFCFNLVLFKYSVKFLSTFYLINCLSMERFPKMFFLINRYYPLCMRSLICTSNHFIKDSVQKNDTPIHKTQKSENTLFDIKYAHFKHNCDFNVKIGYVIRYS